jgi:hypothetical protein
VFLRELSGAAVEAITTAVKNTSSNHQRAMGATPDSGKGQIEGTSLYKSANLETVILKLAPSGWALNVQTNKSR